jgi:lysophospholipase L1-like esterase
MDSTAGFDYANLTGRPAGQVVRALGSVLPGVAAVQRQVVPYARSWRAANLAALARPGARWIVLGDSMSQGIGASAFAAGWVNQVHDRLAAEGIDYRLVNLSASGARVQDVLDQQLPALHALPARTGEDPRPDLVTLLIGSNDLFRRRYRDELPDRFRQLLRALPAGAVVASLPNPRRAAAEVNTLITRAAAGGAITVADLRAGQSISWRGRLAEDHFHPNDLGYAGLARVFHAAITAGARDADLTR